jgi:hypothetical protein
MTSAAAVMQRRYVTSMLAAPWKAAFGVLISMAEISPARADAALLVHMHRHI